MKCAHCTAEARVVDTREQREFLVVRRHRCENGHTFQTVQLLAAVVDSQRKYLEGRLDRAMRGVALRRKQWEDRQRVLALLAEGGKRLAIAAEVGVSEALVRKVAAELRRSEQPAPRRPCRLPRVARKPAPLRELPPLSTVGADLAAVWGSHAVHR